MAHGRYRDRQDDHQDLLVFGYASRLFRDDEKALMVEKGFSLVPWQGDDNLQIDRSVNSAL